MKNVYRVFTSTKLTFFGIILCLLCSLSVSAQTPTITPTESECQATGTVAVTGNTLETAITGSQIPQFSGTAPITFDKLPAGNYVVTQFAVGGAETRYNVTVPGNYKQNWFFSATPQFTPCNNGVPTISIGDFKILDATLDEQRPPYTFRISANNGTLPADGGGTPTYDTPIGGSFPAVAGGKYEIQAMDFCGNYKTLTVNVPSQAPAPTLTSTFIKFANCEGDAEYRFSGSGGNAPYTFIVKQGNTTQNPSTPSTTTPIYILKAGLTYAVTITDNCGGTRTQNVTPKPYVAPTVKLINSPGVCGPNGGSINLETVADGIGPLSYSITNNCNGTVLTAGDLTTVRFDNLQRPCTYQVAVTDGCNKEEILSVALTSPGPESIRCSKEILCPTGASEKYRLKMNVSVRPPYNPTPNYTYVITALGATTPTYTSTINGGSYTSGDLEPGTYDLKITDACGATCTDQVTIAAYQNPTVSIDASSRCFSAGQAMLIGVNNNTLTDPTKNFYEYKIVAPSASKVGQSSETDAPLNKGMFSNLISNGSYTFQFNDGCKTVTTTTTIPRYQQPTWEVGFGAVCTPATTSDLQMVNLQPEGSVVGPYKWRLIAEDAPAFTAPLPFPNSEGQESPIFANLPYRSSTQAATYNFIGVDGCKNSFQGSGRVGTLAEPVIVLDKSKICEDESATLRVRPQIPVVDATYIIYFNGVPIDTSTTLFTTIPNAKPGNYKIRVYPKFATDLSCFGESPAKVVGSLGTLNATNGEINCTTNTVNLIPRATASEAGTITFYEDEALTILVSNPAQATKAITYYAKFVPTADNTCESVKSFLIVNNCFGSIGDYVWFDVDADGVQDSNEDGIEGVVVNLLNNAGDIIDKDTTDVNGFYEFPKVRAGTYQIQIVEPTDDYNGFSTSNTGNNAGTTDTEDSDVNDDGKSHLITIDPTKAESDTLRNNPNIDAGLIRYGSIGDYVWFDKNADGIQDSSDEPIQDVVVNLLNNSGVVIQTTKTNTNGFYEFDSLLNGTYKVQFVKPTDFDDITKANNTADDRDSDIAKDGLSHDIIIDITRANSDTLRNNPNIDAGFINYGSIGDFVWFDENADGIQDNGEKKLTGVKVYLLDLAGNRLDSANTDADGEYLFDSLNSGNYRVQFVLPAAYEAFTKVDATTDDKDSDAGVGGLSPIINIDVTKSPASIERNNLTVDAGVIRSGSIGDYVWFDRNADGIQDTQEKGIEGVRVQLLDNTGQVITTTTTNENGFYQFTGLQTGQYQVRVIEPINQYNGFTVSNTGGNAALADEKDSDVGVDGKSQIVSIDVTKESNDTLRNNPQIDAGLIRYGSIGDYVWFDENADGRQNTNEQGIENVVVELLNASGTVIKTTETIAGGLYKFDSLLDGTYKVRFVKPQDYDDITKPNNTIDNRDSDISTAGLSQDIVIDITKAKADTLRNNPNIDAGFINYGSIGDFVWFDENADGIQDLTEEKLAGVVVNLLNESGAVIQTTTTNNDGEYLFDSLGSGNYRVQFVLPTGYEEFTSTGAGTLETDSDANAAGLSPLVAIDVTKARGSIERDNLTIDAGVVRYGSLGDYVWFDQNADGIQDNTETPIEGVTVKLLDKNDVEIASTTTDENGFYEFTKLKSGEYRVEFVEPAGYNGFTKSNIGDDTKDSDVAANGKSQLVTIDVTKAAADTLRNNPNIDAGLIRYGSIGDYVWFDANGDGDQGTIASGELPIEGVKVELLNAAGAVIDTEVTNTAGFYEFDSLTTGNYRVRFTTPVGYDGFTKRDNAVDGRDSDVGEDGLSELISIDTNFPEGNINRDNPTIDAGVVRYGSIGDLVWFDKNADGIYTNDETVIPNVKVYLLNVLGNRIDSTETNPAGIYEFDSLLSGTYQVEFATPAGYDGFTQTGQGTNLTDSDAGTNGKSSPIVIDTTFPKGNINRDNPTIDAGVVKYGSIGDFVWFDENANGVQDTSEQPIKDVTVNLLNPSGNVIATTNTDATGFYEFAKLNSGTYQVQFVQPTGYNGFTKSNEGDDTKDSDVATDGKSQIVTIDVTKEATDTLRNNPNIDAGLLRYGSIGDYVWFDKDADGIQDNGEEGIQGVTVNLLDENGVTIQTVVTGAGGKYLFDSLVTGDYKVQFMEPDGFNGFTDQLKGGNNATDSNPDDTGLTNTISINTNLPETNQGRNNTRVDAGLVRYGSIGDYVWFDKDRNGLQGDPLVEIPLLGVQVQLLNNNGTLLATTTTNAAGFYEFDSLLSGGYRVQFQKPTGYDGFTTANNPADDTQDSDVNSFGLVTGITINTDLPKGNIGRDNPTIDAGVTQGLGSLGDYVWSDVNEDGLQGDNEPAIEGVTVNLLNSAGSVIKTTNTNAAGRYLFDNLESGQYQVEFVAPPSYDGFTVANNPADDTKDSDVGANGRSQLVTIDNSKLVADTLRNNPNIDAGLIPSLGSIGDYVWYDKNADGIQDDTEEGISGVTVNLLDQNGNVIATTTTGSNGQYGFEELVNGTYQVQVVTPEEFDGTTGANEGTNDAKDSDFNTVGLSQLITIDNSKAPSDTLRNNPQVDAGLVKYGSIGDYVWYDENADGIQDENEEAIQGVTVNLLDQGGTVIQTMVTDENGFYEFDSLLSATYQVQVVEPNGFNGFTTSEEGSDDTEDSNVDNTGLSGMIVIDTDQPKTSVDRNNPTIDAGLIRYGSIGDYVWFDENADGIQDGEEGVEGVTVNLLDEAGNILQTVLTGPNGEYEFDSLTKGNYKIQVVAPDGYDGFSEATQGNDTAKDSNVGTNGTSGVISIDPSLDPADEGRNNPTIDAGLVRYGSIGDYVWLDNNKDGQQGPIATEPVVAGVKVYLLDATTGQRLDSTVTNNLGKYTFDSLGTGSYKVAFAIPKNFSVTTTNIGSDLTDSDAGEDGITHTINIDVTLNKADTLRNNPNIDLGLNATGSLGNYVWEDRDRDGRQDNNEPAVAGVKVFLLNAAGNKLDSTVTNTNGFYEFTGLDSGNYRVKFELPEGTIATIKDAVEDTDDSDADQNGLTRIYTIDTTKEPLNLQRNNPTVDLGIVRVGSIGDYVWFDEDKDGVQDTNEEPVKDVKVNLLDKDGKVIATTTTDENGAYLFENLPAGTYQIQFVAPDGQVFTTPNLGADDKDSDAGTDGKTSPVIIDTTKPIGDPARDNRDVDAGLVEEIIPYGSIGDYVWFDDNANGIQDGTEMGIKGITVNLLNAAGQIIQTEVTDDNGKYLFDSLTNGTYQVQFVNGTGQPFTTPNQPDDAKDSDAGADGKSQLVTINTSLAVSDIGRNNMTIDAGIIPPYGSIGDYVWNDKDADGIQDADEAPVPGVTVNLLDENGIVIATTTTDENGEYLFDSLLTGTYEVQFIAPEDTEFTQLGQGNETNDSDAGTDGKSGQVVIDTTKPIGDPARDNRDLDAGIVDICVNPVLTVGTPICAVTTYSVTFATDRGLVTTSAGTISGNTVTAIPVGTNITITATDGTCVTTRQVVSPVDCTDPCVSPKITVSATTCSADGKTYSVSYTLVNGASISASSGTVGNGVITGIPAGTAVSITVAFPNCPNSIVPVASPTCFVPVFDLALIKKVVSTAPFVAGDTVTFSLQVLNQGNLPAFNVEVTDYIPTGMSLADNAWVASGSNATRTIAGPIAAAGNTVTTIKLKINDDFVGTSITNSAEISKADDDTNPNNTPPVDKDGTLDNNPNNNGPVKDDITSEDNKANPTTDDLDSADPATIVVTPNQVLGSIGDYVWVDKDDDGVQDTDEVGVKDVKLTLWTADASGNPATELESTTTDENGRYLFDELPAGRYIVILDRTTLPDGASLTTKTDVGNDASDSDFNPTSGRSAVVTLTPTLGGIDKDNLTIDGGIVIPLGSIGDYVWNDTDGDGIQDDNEAPVEGVTVNLLDDNGNVIATTTTDENGEYLFDDLPSGVYEVEFVAPAGTEFTQPGQGNEANDSDAGTDGKSGSIVIDTNFPSGDPRRDNRDVDAGIVIVEVLGSIGDYVWVDKDSDGVQDTDEVGVKDVKLTLWTADASGNPVTELESTTTDENGKYLFDELPAGQYIVIIDEATLPDGSSLTTTNVGDDATDSDFDNTYRSPVVTLNPELGGIDKDNLTIDAGVIVVPVIGTFTDLRLTKIVSTPTAQIGDIVTYTIKLENVGTKDTTGVQVIEALFVGARYVSHTTTSGTYNVNDKIWTTGGVSAGATVELVVNVQIISGGAWINSVRINDPNGPPNDSVSVCLSAIIPICPERDEKVVLSAPADYSSYQWYNNNQPISGAIGKTYEAKSAGSYTVKVNNGQCPAEGCCPIVVAEVCECKVEICIPFEIKKVK